MNRVRRRAEGRWYERLYHGPDYDIWLISWLPGQSTRFHHHGASSGAFVAATGTLEEHRSGEQTLVIHPGQPRAFGPDYPSDRKTQPTRMPIRITSAGVLVVMIAVEIAIVLRQASHRAVLFSGFTVSAASLARPQPHVTCT
jgi:hypothetical protein